MVALMTDRTERRWQRHWSRAVRHHDAQEFAPALDAYARAFKVLVDAGREEGVVVTMQGFIAALGASLALDPRAPVDQQVRRTSERLGVLMARRLAEGKDVEDYERLLHQMRRTCRLRVVPMQRSA